jgi:transposase
VREMTDALPECMERGSGGIAAALLPRRWPGLALVALSVIEQRYGALIAVLDGASRTEVAAEAGVSRQSVHLWVAGYREGGLSGGCTLGFAGRTTPSLLVARRLGARLPERSSLLRLEMANRAQFARKT